MKKPGIPENEDQRVGVLRSLNILDTPPEERFDRLTRLAKRLFNVPISLVTFVDTNRQWFKSCIGLDVRQTSRDISFCSYAMLSDECFVVSNTTKDERFSNNPMVTGEPYIRFYAGCPLKFSDGTKLGTLCIMDTEPREFYQDDIDALYDLTCTAERDIAATYLATADSLTMLNNQRGFEYLSNKQLALCERHKIPASLVYFDLDNFKSINDDYGHSVGDSALKLFGHAIHDICRDSDIPGRLHGDVFTLLLINSTSAQSEVAVSRLNDKLDADIATEDQDFEISYSYGIIQYNDSIHSNIEHLLYDADHQMSRMKSDHKLGKLNVNNRDNPAILIIDDDESYCDLLTAFIKVSYPHADISTLDPNEYSLGAVEDETDHKEYDLIFLDYELGGFKNGLDWYIEHSSIRSLPPTILNSAHVDENIAGKALDAGIIDFLPKTQVSALRIKIGIDQAITHTKTVTHEIQKVANSNTLQLDLGPTVAFDGANESYISEADNRDIAKEKIYIEEYQLLRQIGQGGMARIYHALDKDKKDIALKVFVPNDELPEDYFGRFIAEGEVLSGIDHPNIIKVFDTGYTDEYAFIAMELLSEKTLASYDFPLKIDKAVSLIGDISSGLALVHSKGIVHRDIKPSNILFSPEGIPKLADFGIAKDLSADLNLTRQGTAVGTPTYMSPEQVLGDPITHLSDLYAIGILFYQLLTGEVPFTSHNHIEVMTDHAQTPAPRLPENMYALDIVTQTLLQKKPHDRYLSANILHHELMTILSYGLYS